MYQTVICMDRWMALKLQFTSLCTLVVFGYSASVLPGQAQVLVYWLEIRNTADAGEAIAKGLVTQD
jgi:hypothetical protein